ncbi:MAG TPA: TetR/AcrR family transcriptional regulator C-terminal domain-containing protein, partial [Chthonomonadaceae bacterium]|nr:TetR/AcrR family transcriptional regulator C-terminal domain-containing protein [Chthonomonadaceae bacterium]
MPSEQQDSGACPIDTPLRVRHRVAEAAADLVSGAGHDNGGGSRSGAARMGGAPPGHAGADVYLAMLQDRLPVYVHSLSAATAQAGNGSVDENLSLAAHATICFYASILPVKVSVLAIPAELIELRHAMKARRLGPGRAEETVAWYLREEQQLGRVAADADPRASARLLLGACLSYSFTAMLLGDEGVPPPDEYVPDLVRGLRLAPLDRRRG